MHPEFTEDAGRTRIKQKLHPSGRLPPPMFPEKWGLNSQLCETPHRMFRVLEAATADALWLKAADWFSSDGIATRQDSRNGLTFEVLRAALTLQDPRQPGRAPEFPRSSHKAVSRLPSCYGEPMVPVTPSFFSSSHVSPSQQPHRRKAASIFGETPRLCSLSLSSLFNPIAQSGATCLGKP